MMKAKYVAEGFLEDEIRLLREFVDANSVEFPVFASVWKKYNFSCIFAGRPDRTELAGFTNEAYRITSEFLSSDSFMYRVGAVYLMYGLFQNQLCDPPIMIRLEHNHWEKIIKMKEIAITKQYQTLYYVIAFLIEKAFVYVANQTCRGPMTSGSAKLTKNESILAEIKTTYKNQLIEYKETNHLDAIDKVCFEYLELKKHLDPTKSEVNPAFKSYSDAMKSLEGLLSQEPQLDIEEEISDCIGTRRTRIKTTAFTNKSYDYRRRIAESDSDVPDDPQSKCSKTPPRPKRLPKQDRKVGRPRKHPLPVVPKEDDDIKVDISHLVEQQKNFYLPPDDEPVIECEGKRRTRAMRKPYFGVPPKYEDDE